MRTEKENTSRRKETFKSSKKIKNGEKNSSESSIDESDEQEVNFVRKHEKGSRKFKGKLPFKYFNYGKIGHFASKCPYPK